MQVFKGPYYCAYLKTSKAFGLEVSGIYTYFNQKRGGFKIDSAGSKYIKEIIVIIKNKQ